MPEGRKIRDARGFLRLKSISSDDPQKQRSRLVNLLGANVYNCVLQSVRISTQGSNQHPDAAVRARWMVRAVSIVPS
jgi:hypothetical protein